MPFWILAPLMTVVACSAVLMPLVRRNADMPTGTEHDLEVYRDQLAEFDRHVERGLIEKTEAEQA